MSEDYFLSGPYGTIATDCADSVYAARLIFSFENSLPFFVSGLSERSSRFDHVSDPKDRFLAFLYLVMQKTSTLTLSQDTYPVALDRRFLKPGIIFLQRRSDTGHVELVKSVFENGVIQFAASTLPIKARRLVITTSLTVMPADSNSGFRAWIQPEKRGLSQKQQPGYSLEQFQGIRPDTSDQLKIWTKKLHAKLALEPEPIAESVSRLSQDLCRLIKSRIEVVQDAYHYKNQVRRCLNKTEYEAYSTPGKDRRILRTLEQTLTFLFPEQPRLEIGMIDHLSQELEGCQTIEYFSDRSLPTIEFLKKLALRQVASDPNETMNERWGTTPLNGNSCPQF